jgi:hypothetical protein
MGSLTVVLVAVFFLGMGLYALAVPARVLAVFGVSVTTPEGRNEVRAVYGGYGVAIGAVLLAALAQPGWRDGILVCQAAALAGMAGGRVVSAVVDGRSGFYPWLFCALEALMAAVLCGAAQNSS